MPSLEMEQPLRRPTAENDDIGGGGPRLRKMMTKGSKFHAAVAVSRTGSNTDGLHAEKRLRRPAVSAKTSVFQTLSSRSKTSAAKVYRTVTLVLILTNVVAFLASTNDQLSDRYSATFELIEGVTSCIFLADYVLRIATITENRMYKAKGAVWGRLSWALSAAGVLDALSTFPYFLDNLLLHNKLPSLTWIKIFRVFLLFRTSKYSHAMNTVSRVLWVNSEILGVSTFLVGFMVLFTSALLYMTSTPEERKINGIDDVPSAMYLAVLMLTGQATPEGDLSVISKCMVMLTAFLSVPFFAVPAAMLTWGFEGEAERLAQQQRKRHAREKLYSAEMEGVLSSSSSEDEGDNLEDYLDLVGGADDEDAGELEERALAFFESATLGPMLPEARKLAAELESSRVQAKKQKQLQEDALTLLGQVNTHHTGDVRKCEEDRERRLQLFRKRVLEEQASKDASDEDEVSNATILKELKSLRQEIAALRQ